MTAALAQGIIVVNPDVPRLLLGLAALVAASSVIASVVLAASAQRFGARATWQYAAGVALFLVLLWVYATQRGASALFPLPMAFYMATALVGAPLAAATWAVTRSLARRPERRLGAHALRGWLAFVGGLFCGVLLAVIPDVVKLLERS